MRRENPTILAYLQAPDRYPWVHQSAVAPPMYPGLERVGPNVGRLLDNLRIQPGGSQAPQDMPMGPAGVMGLDGPPAEHVQLSQVLAPPIPDTRPDPVQAPWGMAPAQPIMNGTGQQIGRFESGVAPASSPFPVMNAADEANAANPLRPPQRHPAAQTPPQARPGLLEAILNAAGMGQLLGNGR